MRSPHLVRPRLALLLAAGLTALVTPAGVAHAATATVPATGTPITITSTEQLAPGVTYGSFEVTTPRGVGSSTVAVREPGQAAATARNSPSDGTERMVANGIGIFVGKH
ncbi:hypothetical protein ACLQ3F_09755 [Micromonospora sp. DT15]|uniref:hypothetical protein n=1 Tax=unclassified Micromonospora TaxID=2617518 RepID=UPI0033D1AD09